MVEIDHNILQGAIVGLVNDDKTTVGKVHLGVCIILRVTREEAKALVVNCESTLANPQFVPVAQLSDPDFLREMETWSIYFAEHILNTHYTEGKWTDKAFVERVGMLAITSANLASSASGFLMQHSHHGHLVSKDMVEKSAGEVQCLLAGMIANEDIESHLVKKNAKEFHSMLPNILKHQPYRK